MKRHLLALVDTGAVVGENTRVWAYAHLLPGCRVGDDCNICDGVFIENDVVVGNRVTIKCGVQLWDGVRLEDDVFVGPNVTFSNDPFPRSRHRPEKFMVTTVCRGASIGANATILPGITIGADALVGAGSVVTNDVPPKAIVMGNPARITGYVGASRENTPGLVGTGATTARHCSTGLRVAGVALHHFPAFVDLRGELSVGNFESEIPFVPARYFFVHHVPGKEVRGEHAHRKCKQFLICVSGSVVVVVDDGRISQEVLLGNLNTGLYIPPMVWAVQYRYTSDAVLLVFASEAYESCDYIREYAQFRELVGVATA